MCISSMYDYVVNYCKSNLELMCIVDDVSGYYLEKSHKIAIIGTDFLTKEIP